MRPKLPLTFGLSLFFSLFLIAGCGVSERCGVPGVTTTCGCPDATVGARVCGADLLWAACDCSGAIPLPNPIEDTRDPETGGTPPTTGGGGSQPRSGGTVVRPDGGPGTGGTNERDAAMADAAMTDAAMPGDSYTACADDGDCQQSARCLLTPSFPSNASVCTPRCIDVGDCPVPPGSYEAKLGCVTGYCQFDCTPVLFSPLLTCPGELSCVTPLFGTSYCHHLPN